MNKLKYIKFYEFTNGMVVAGIFGSYENKIIRAKLGKQLVNANKNNKSSKKFYREYKVINDFVATMEFDHCMTIHKSQGSEYDNVYVDSADLAKCINRSEMMKLLYVAMSRAKNKIFLNN
jgi:ATP-dependent exoDNAse (exonuclease V) alpha subunit